MTDNSITKTELSRMLLTAAQHECKSAKTAMSEGNAAGARVAMQHRWRLFGIQALARDLFEADMIEGSYYGLIVEALDHAFSLDIRDMGAWADGEVLWKKGDHVEFVDDNKTDKGPCNGTIRWVLDGLACIEASDGFVHARWSEIDNFRVSRHHRTGRPLWIIGESCAWAEEQKEDQK